MGAIVRKDGRMEVDQNECVECGVCVRLNVCPKSALEQPELDRNRAIRKQFSDPLTPHPSTTLAGRGTEEIKTNDVTNRIGKGFLGIGVEMGRPGVGTWMRDVQTVTQAIASVGVHWEECNPLTTLIADKNTGKLDPSVMDVKVLSCILEFSIRVEQLEALLKAVHSVEDKIDTVFSLSMITVFNDDGSLPGLETLKRMGFSPRPNAKINLGLGRAQSAQGGDIHVS